MIICGREWVGIGTLLTGVRSATTRREQYTGNQKQRRNGVSNVGQHGDTILLE